MKATCNRQRGGNSSARGRVSTRPTPGFVTPVAVMLRDSTSTSANIICLHWTRGNTGTCARNPTGRIQFKRYVYAKKWSARKGAPPLLEGQCGVPLCHQACESRNPSCSDLISPRDRSASKRNRSSPANKDRGVAASIFAGTVSSHANVTR